MKILTIQEAKNSILKRKSILNEEYSNKVIQNSKRFFDKDVSPMQAVRIILRSVAENGDLAVKDWSSKFDNYSGSILVPKEKLKKAWDETSPVLKTALILAEKRIREFHEHQKISSWMTEKMGGEMGQRITPIQKVGVYVPGGTAPLVSSLLMSVIPAQVAGVKDISVCTPPIVSESILAAAYLCDIEQIYQIGGTQAIAALAYGTETIKKVDKIVGAGNLYVTLAKQQLYGLVGIDGLAGPTETMIIADKNANAKWIASDLLAQAEHDVQSSAILLTNDRAFAEKVLYELIVQTEDLTRKKIIKESFNDSSGIILVDSLDQAAKIADDYAAEHLCLAVKDSKNLMGKINNAGGFFLGDYSYEVLGDYVAGPSHVMPTNGTARFASPLNVFDFIKISSVIGLDKKTGKGLSQYAKAIADLEMLTAHAAAANARIEG